MQITQQEFGLFSKNPLDALLIAIEGVPKPVYYAVWNATMDEEPTKDLPGHLTFEERVFAEFAAMHSQFATVHSEFAAVRSELGAVRRDIAAIDLRLTTLEERVDVRLHETRPIWEAVQLQIKRLDEKFDIVIRELYEVRVDTALHGKRLNEIERRLNS